MTRKDFLKMCSILGAGLPLQASLQSCNNEEDPIVLNFSGKVLILGAGAGGLSAGYLLQQQGIEFEILEASTSYGGRLKINTNFADFPIPLGAEWLHASTDEFQKMVNDDNIQVEVDTINYNAATDTFATWKNNQLRVSPLDDSDIKFVNYSWFNFYEEYIVPSIANKIVYNSIVQSIDYTGDQVVVNTQNGQYTADKVIVALPLKVLQQGSINFNPALPQSKRNAINNSLVWDGFKAFFEFSEKFYDTQIGFDISPETDGQKLYYDAAYGQNTSRHILGLFTVGKPVQDYAPLSDFDLKEFVLAELDEIYDNQASPNYLQHTSQNWNADPFIQGGYLSDHADWREVRELGKSVADQVYFAGGAYTNGEDWVSVHAAAQSALEAVGELVR